jgi:hypothetical protein
VGFILSTLEVKDKKTKEIITSIGRKRFGDINVTVDIKKHLIAFEASKIMIKKTKLKIVECFKKMDQLLSDLPKDALLLNSEDVCEMFKKVIVGEDRSAWAKLGEQQKERVVTLSEMVFDLYTQTTCDVREWKTSGEGVKKEMSHFLNPVVQPNETDRNDTDRNETVAPVVLPNETDRNEQVSPRDNHQEAHQEAHQEEHQEEHKEAYQEEHQEESVFQFNELVGVNTMGVEVNPVVHVLIDTERTENSTNRAAPETESVAPVVLPNENAPNETVRNEQVSPRDNHQEEYQEEHKEAYQEEHQEEPVFQFNELAGVNMMGVEVNPVVHVIIDTEQTVRNESVAPVVLPNETDRSDTALNETVVPVVLPNETAHNDTDRNESVAPVVQPNETDRNEQVSQGLTFEQGTPSAINIHHTETKTGGLPFGDVGSWKKADALHTQKEPVGTATRERKANVGPAERANGQKLPEPKTDNDGFKGVNPLGGRTTPTNDVKRVWEPRAAEQSRGEQKLEKREGTVVQSASGGANESARGRNKRKQKSTRRRHKNSRMRFNRKKVFSKRKKTSRKKRLKK